MKPVSIQPRELDDAMPLTVSLKTLARRLDAHRSSVRHRLREADSDADACRLRGEPGTLSE